MDYVLYSQHSRYNHHFHYNPTSRTNCFSLWNMDMWPNIYFIQLNRITKSPLMVDSSRQIEYRVAEFIQCNIDFLYWIHAYL